MQAGSFLCLHRLVQHFADGAGAGQHGGEVVEDLGHKACSREVRAEDAGLSKNRGSSCWEYWVRE